jgi:hypothetical protein
MKLHGRITVYGEFLMHGQVAGLTMPSRLFLASPPFDDTPLHFQYSTADDKVADFMRQLGIQPQSEIRGDLPLGQGLASSTVLALLHAGPGRTNLDIRKLVTQSDHALHGFEPSGVDFEAVTRQRAGLFSSHGWNSVNLTHIPHSLVFLPPERRLSLPEVRSKLERHAVILGDLARALTDGVTRRQRLDYDKFLRYCEALLQAEVYATPAATLIRNLLERGFAAKAIGGLYDKAIFVAWRDADSAHRSTTHLQSYAASHAFFPS